MIFEHHGQCYDVYDILFFSMRLPWGFFIPWSSGQHKNDSHQFHKLILLSRGWALPYPMYHPLERQTQQAPLFFANMHGLVLMESYTSWGWFFILIPRPTRFSLIHPLVGRISGTIHRINSRLEPCVMRARSPLSTQRCSCDSKVVKSPTKTMWSKPINLRQHQHHLLQRPPRGISDRPGTLWMPGSE